MLLLYWLAFLSEHGIFGGKSVAMLAGSGIAVDELAACLARLASILRCVPCRCIVLVAYPLGLD